MLRDAGGGVTPDKLLRVQNTLTAAAVDAQARTALQAGHLERELTAPGFDVFGGARPPATRRTQREAARPRAETRPRRTDRGGGGTGSGEGRGAATRNARRRARSARHVLRRRGRS